MDYDVDCKILLKISIQNNKSLDCTCLAEKNNRKKV